MSTLQETRSYYIDSSKGGRESISTTAIFVLPFLFENFRFDIDHSPFLLGYYQNRDGHVMDDTFCVVSYEIVNFRRIAGEGPWLVAVRLLEPLPLNVKGILTIYCKRIFNCTFLPETDEIHILFQTKRRTPFPGESERLIVSCD